MFYCTAFGNVPEAKYPATVWNHRSEHNTKEDAIRSGDLSMVEPTTIGYVITEVDDVRGVWIIVDEKNAGGMQYQWVEDGKIQITKSTAYPLHYYQE